jgi:hypothetical protein
MVSKRSEPETRSLMGIPRSREIQTIGMPSAGHRSLRISDSLNSVSLWAIIIKLTLGVESKNGRPAAAALVTFFKAEFRSTASISIPKTPYVSRAKSSACGGPAGS